ncbi:hypothetical protein OGAPHI_002736 [Ogataea philodendri]|uniref:Nuclear segregation protein BFR1 n=1 Tax=Ogataea philodendri TaxID=1378263 RepID=A0A9P8PBY8_9ASCO|nr:uncharacterized protein OGAPHI_002736 [Ogataea philodendri]KAH3668981.1 hypothetical protein OGAPHI_002736 [Ogataea philodendri]
MSDEVPEVKVPRARRFIKQPDAKAKNAKISELNKDLDKFNKEIEALNKQIEITVTPQDVQDERKKLNTELSAVIKQQSEIKNKRNLLGEQIRAIDSQLKKKISDLQAQTSKNSFKNVEEIDKKINQLEDLIGSGSLKLVDERRYVKEISSLRKLKKDFGSTEQLQKSVDNDKLKIQDLKKKQAAISNKEVQAQFETITKQLDTLSLKNKGVQDKRKVLFDKRKALYTKKDGIYAEINKVRSDFDAQHKKFVADLEAERKRREEEEKIYNLTLKKKSLETEIETLKETSKRPAYTHEISLVETLLAHFDPSYVRAEKEPLEESKVATNSGTTRKIEMPENAVIIKKEQENFFSGTNAKKGKKSQGKKQSSKFVIDPDVIVQLSELSVALPTKAEEVPTTIESLKAKLEGFKSKQDDKTKENVAKAEEKAAKLEAEIAKIDAEIEEEARTKVVKAEAETN